MQKGWRAGFAPACRRPQRPALPDLYALLEMLHAIRDNLKIDLRDDAVDYFAHLPAFLISGNYPGALPRARKRISDPGVPGRRPARLKPGGAGSRRRA